MTHDRFGNPLDPAVGYARGTHLASPLDEFRRRAHGLDQKGLSCLTPRGDHERAGIVVIALDDAAARQAELRDKRFILTAVEGGLRVAPHFYNTEQELDNLVEAL